MHFILYGFILVFAWIVGYYLARRSKYAKYKLPPGPVPIPILGNFYQINPLKMHITFDEWKQKYGDVFMVQLGSIPAVVLSSHGVVKETLVGQAETFAWRPKIAVFDELHGGEDLGYGSSNGDFWKQQRRHAITTLRDFGVGRSLQEEKIELQIQELFEEIDRRTTADPNSEMDFRSPLQVAVVNIIMDIIIGKTFTHDDPKLRRFQECIAQINSGANVQFVFDFLPMLKIFKGFSGIKQIRRNAAEIQAFFMQQIEEHHQSMKNGEIQTPTDFTYAYLAEMDKKAKDPDQSTNYFSKQQLVAGLIDLYTAGFDTTSTTLYWFMYAMASYPQVQSRMRGEIMRQVNGKATWTNRTQLPYCLAVIAELQRWANISAIDIFRQVQEDATAGGYDIPAGSYVITAKYSMMRDPKLFPDPDIFMPERFLDKDSGEFVDHKESAPFSVGKRACLGESLARMELFMFATAMVTRYDLAPPIRGLPDKEPMVGLALVPKPFSVRVKVVGDD